MRWVPRTTPLFIVFWLVLSGHFEPLLLSLGAVSVALVCWLTWRADLFDSQHLTARRILRLPGYLAWLGTDVLRSAVAVTRMAWAPRFTPEPVVEFTPLPPMSPLGQATYANSITFTPGTLSLDIEDDRIQVHSLDPAGVSELRTGAMVGRVERLEDPR